MSNNYTQFSEEITDLTDEEMDWLDKVLHTNPGDPDELPKLLELLGTTELGDDDLDCCCWPGFEFSIDKKERSLWFYSEENYSEAPLITIFQAFLKRFRPTMRVAISIAYYCDKMRIGEFGGAWLLIGADECLAGSTWDSINDAT